MRAAAAISCLALACTGTVDPEEEEAEGERGPDEGERGGGEGEGEGDDARCPADRPFRVDGQCRASCPATASECEADGGAGCCAPGESCCEDARNGDPCSIDGECPEPCPGGAGGCMADEMCRWDGESVAHRCHAACAPRDGRCGDRVCCPFGAECRDGACLMPDLVFDAERIAKSHRLEEETLAADDCQVVEGCAGGPGRRRLLRFDLLTMNVGEGDLDLRDTSNTDLFEQDPCHGHAHFTGFSRYRVIDGQGREVAPGRKQSWCIIDMQAGPGAGPSRGGGCNYLTAGWIDVYSAGLDCQFVDVTDVEPGDYTLEVTANPDHVLAELDYANNTVGVPVTIR